MKVWPQQGKVQWSISSGNVFWETISCVFRYFWGMRLKGWSQHRHRWMVLALGYTQVTRLYFWGDGQLRVCKYNVWELFWNGPLRVFLHQIVTLNSFRPSDAMWRHRSGSTLAQVMACCLTTPSHYLNQCWVIISKVQWHPSESNFTRDTSAISHWN